MGAVSIVKAYRCIGCPIALMDILVRLVDFSFCSIKMRKMDPKAVIVLACASFCTCISFFFSQSGDGCSP